MSFFSTFFVLFFAIFGCDQGNSEESPNHLSIDEEFEVEGFSIGIEYPDRGPLITLKAKRGTLDSLPGLGSGDFSDVEVNVSEAEKIFQVKSRHAAIGKDGKIRLSHAHLISGREKSFEADARTVTISPDGHIRGTGVRAKLVVDQVRE